jgi:hypothetical protein
MKSFLWSFIIIIGLIILVSAAVIWSGVYNVAADSRHWKVTFGLLNEAREESIESHSRGIVAPPLQEEKLVDRGSIISTRPAAYVMEDLVLALLSSRRDFIQNLPFSFLAKFNRN